MSLEDVNVSHNPDVKTCTESYLLRSFGTKSSPILALHFTRRNLLFGIGRFDAS
jgi:transcription initiation factor TFIID subunit 5